MAGKGRRKKQGSQGSDVPGPKQSIPALGGGSLKRWQNIALLLIPIIFLGVYAETLDHPFYFDDTTNIIDNPHIRLEEFNLAGLKRAVAGGHLQRRPVANLSFAFNYLLGEYNPALYRLVNVLIHGLNGLLLFCLVNLTLRLPAAAMSGINVSRIAYATALIWLVHPLHIQSVTYIVQRMNSMASMFYLLAMLCYVKSRQSKVPGRKKALLTGCLASGLLAMGSKEIAITLPFMIWIYEWFFFQNLDRRWFKVNAVSLAIGFGLGLLILTVLFLAGQGFNPLETIVSGYANRAFTPGQRLLTELRVVVFYVFLFLWPQPSRLSLLHDFSLSNSLLDPLSTLGALVFLLVMAAGAVRLAKSHRVLSFCLIWFMGNLLLESSIIGLEIIFEHRTYLPSMFLMLFFILIFRKSVHEVRIRRAVLVGILLLFSVWTYQRNQVWGNKVDFWIDCLAKCPTEIRIHNNLGQALENEGRVEEAMKHYRQAIEHNAMFADAYNNLGLALEKVGDEKEAIMSYRSVLSFDPDNPDAHYNLGSFLGKKGRGREALLHLEQAHRNLPVDADPDVHNNMGIILAMHGRLDEATTHFNEALRIDPGDVFTHNNLGLTYARAGNFALAKKHFRQVLRLEPGFEEARQNLLLIARKEKELR